MSNRRLHDWQRATVVDNIPVAEGVRRVVLDLPGRPVAAPGSHLDVLLPLPAGEVVRSYSVVDDGRCPGRLSIGVRLDAINRGGSSYIHRLRPGDALTASQPVQTFDLTWGRPQYTLLAGGIGITPLVGMARRLRSWGAEYELVYVGRSRSTMPFVENLLADHPGRVRLHLSDERGRMDIDSFVQQLPIQTELYVCGPMGMLVAAQRSWASHDRPADRLRFETFGSSGTAPAVPFRVRVPRLGLETLVSADMTLLDALEASGAEVMSDCMRGECGLCVVEVLDHDQDLDHRDVFLSERQRALGDKLCACVSRCLAGTLTINIP